MSKYHGASYQHMWELLDEHESISIPSKTIGRIRKEASIPHRHTHKASRNRRPGDVCPRRACSYNVMPASMSGLSADTPGCAFMEP
nr:hypothetical protein [Thermovirga lienii]